MNKEKLALIEKAKGVFSPYEIATPSVLKTINLMADFAEDCIKEERKRIADALESQYGGEPSSTLQTDILNTVIALRRSAE